MVEESKENVLNDDVLGTSVDEVDELDDGTAAAELEDVLPFKSGAARAAFEDRKAAVKSPTGQAPALHALDLQHPRNGGKVFAHVYQRLLVEHC